MATNYKSEQIYFSSIIGAPIVTAPAQTIVNSIHLQGSTGVVTIDVKKQGQTARPIIKTTSSQNGEISSSPIVLEANDQLMVTPSNVGVSITVSYAYSSEDVAGQSISVLNDVSIDGITDGQVLVWNDSIQEFEPGAGGGGGSITSVNGDYGPDVVIDATDIDYDVSTTVSQAIATNTSNYNLLKGYVVTTDPDKVVVTKDSSNKIDINGTVGSESIVLTTDGTNAVTVTDTKVDVLPVVNATGGLTVNNNTDTYSLPANRGLANTVLVSDGAGTTSFQKAILPTSDSTLPVQGVDFSLTPTATLSDGRLMYDADRETLIFQSAHGELAIGETFKPVINTTASNIAAGSFVKATGVNGERFTIELFDASSGVDEELYFLGVTQSQIDAGAEGVVVSEGLVKHLNTSAHPVGTILYASETAGAFTATKPLSPNLGVVVAMVTKQDASNGTIYVRPEIYSHLGEIHDVIIAAPSSGQLLNYNAGLGVWINTSDIVINNADITTIDATTINADNINVGYALDFTGGGTSTIGAGINPDDLAIRSNGNVIITLDDDNDEPAQKLAINNGADTEVFSVDEDGHLDLIGDITLSATSDLLVGGDHYAFKYNKALGYGFYFNLTNATYDLCTADGSAVFEVNVTNGDTDINRDLQVGRNLNVIGHITVPEFVEGETNKNDRISFSEFGVTAGRIHDIGGNSVGPSSATATYKLGFCEDITANLILRGLVSVGTTISGTPALGQPLYLGASGTIVATAPSTSGDIVRVIGHYMGEEQGAGSLVYFDPSNDWVEIA